MRRCLPVLALLACGCARDVAAVLELDVRGREGMSTRSLQVSVELAAKGSRLYVFDHDGEPFTLSPRRRAHVTFGEDELGAGKVAVSAELEGGGGRVVACADVELRDGRVTSSVLDLGPGTAACQGAGGAGGSAAGGAGGAGPGGAGGAGSGMAGGPAGSGMAGEGGAGTGGAGGAGMGGGAAGGAGGAGMAGGTAGGTGAWSQSGLATTRIESLLLGTRGLCAGTKSEGIFRLPDGGGAWTASSSGLTAPAGQGDPRWVFSLAADPARAATLYAGTNGAGVYKSTNDGDTWSHLTIDLGVPGPIIYVKALAVASNSIYAGMLTGGLYKSDDGGVSWRSVSGGFSGIQALLADADTPGTLYVGHNGGAQVTTDGGSSWSSLGTGLPAVVALAQDGANLYAAGPSGVFRSLDRGATWLSTGLTTNTRAIVVRAPGRVHVGTSVGIFVSTDAGGAWVENNGGLTDLDVTSLAFDRAGKLYAGTAHGIFRLD